MFVKVVFNKYMALVYGEYMFYSQKVFGKGMGNADNYRIPALVVTNKNTVIACADERFFTATDNPNKIDKVVRRSFDDGKTWGRLRTAVASIGISEKKSVAAIDPALLHDAVTNTTFMLYCKTPAGIGLLNSKASVGMEDGGYIVRKDYKKFILKNGRLYKNGKATDVEVDEQGFIENDGNIYLGTSSYRIEQTSYLMICSSDDEGENWTTPICLNESIKKKHWRFIGPGPGCGIQIKEGKYKGRLVFPVYYSWFAGDVKIECAVIYSDDHGKTWNIGTSPYVPGKWPKVNAKLMSPSARLTESQIVELEDGVLKIFMRNHNPKRRIATALSYDGGETWVDSKYNATLVQPVSQFAAISFDYEGKRLVVTCNPANEKTRINGIIRISEDGGETFPYSRQLTPDEKTMTGYFGYSSLAFLPDKTVGLLFEPDETFEAIEFAKFSIDWIKGKTDEQFEGFDLLED